MNRLVLFGKLPAHGDFVARGLSTNERAWWDGALSAGLVAAGGVAMSTAAYDRAPPWRFLLSRPEGELSGTLAASMDAAGRRFPVMVAYRGRDSAMAAGCEMAVYDALADGWTADALLAAVRAADAPPPPVARGWWVDGGAVDGHAPVEDGDPAVVIPAMIALGAMA